MLTDVTPRNTSAPPAWMTSFPNCGGQLKIIAAILEARVIQRNLRHLGLQARAPPRAPARGDLQQAA